ncbi:APC family permease [Marinobacterium sp. LSUCC0821]|jgi:amino acid transporter|uniref:APC family permease n=1 Tax=Marinobacterium sp. LSUCC0821 TaxID=2668067 RepID=UPI0014517EE8|nr:amino acid permease [Marinobacterium sp. LSUCC0821]QJD71816.1 amino acid permease [Marinobacterium sp. LSUCC0821]
MSSIQPTQLARRITLPLLVLYGLGVTIGAGIYVLIGLTIEEAGIYAPTAFIVSAIVMGFTAASFIELSGRYPHSAAEAIYVEKSFGWSWLTILTGGSISVAAIVAAAAISVGSAGYIQHLIDLPEPLIVSALILLMGLLAVYGILESVVFAGILTAIELSGLLAIIGIGLWVHPEVLEQLPDVIPSFNDNSAMIAIFSTVLIAFFAFIGFDDVVNLVEEVRNPTKVMPIGIVVTLVVVTVLYFLVVAIAVLVIPNQELIESKAPISLMFNKLTGLPSFVITLVAIVATLNGVVIQIITGARVLYGMAHQGRAPTFLGRVSPKTQTPIAATLLITVLTLISALFFPIDTLATLTTQLILFVFTLVNLGLVIIKLRGEKAKLGTIQVSLVFPILGFLSCLFLLIGGWLHSP